MTKRQRPQDEVEVEWETGWAQVPSELIRETGISRNARMLWCLLASFANKSKTAWPSQETICEFLGEGARSGEVSRRSVHRWSLELWQTGWVTIIRTRSGHRYKLHRPDLQEIARRRLLKSPFEDDQGDTGVTCDGIVESHQGDTGVTSHEIPESHAWELDPKNKTHELDPSIHAAADRSDLGEPAGWMDGWDQLLGIDQGRFLYDVGVRSLTAAREFLSTPRDLLEREWAKVECGNGNDKPALFISNLRRLPKPITSPALTAAAPPPLDPVTDPRRPEWITPAQWADFPDEELRENLQGTWLEDGAIMGTHEEVVKHLMRWWRYVLEPLVSEQAVAV